MIRFTIPGEPTGKGRPRMTRAGRAFTPAKTASYENLIKVEYERQCMGERFGDDAQLAMRITARYGVAQSDSAKKRTAKLDGAIRPTKKPDCDNVAKIVADALNGLAYRDDAQIVCMVVEKVYDTVPRVEVEIDTI